jgi:pyruvate dehydrogenase complex dehydrogenase (E1) component
MAIPEIHAMLCYATLTPWFGAVAGGAIVPLGVDCFGQSGGIRDLYRAYGIDTGRDLRRRCPRLAAGAALNLTLRFCECFPVTRNSLPNK